MGLRQRQSQFALAYAKLILRINGYEAVPMQPDTFTPGYEVTLGDAYRDPRLHGDFGEKQGYGRSTSCHKLRMAGDLNLFYDGDYLATTTAHSEFGEWWESEFSDYKASWGGRFNDGNHYSFEVWGSK